MTYREQIRQARLAAKLSYSEMQRLTGIHRDQYRKFEDGANITTNSLEKILSVIPNIPPLHIGKATVATDRSDLAEVRATAKLSLAVMQQLLAVIDAKMERPGAAAAETQPATKSNFDDVDPALLAELQEEARRLQKTRPDLSKAKKTSGKATKAS
ncbi:MAG TPA: helix-turn-helix transcriptional regulator [Thermoanaerobaculia bacterium]